MSKEDLVEYCAPGADIPSPLILGSGLGALADRVKVDRRIPYEDIDGFSAGTLPHRGPSLRGAGGHHRQCRWLYQPRALVPGYNASGNTSLVRHARSNRLPRHHSYLRFGAVRDASRVPLALLQTR